MDASAAPNPADTPADLTPAQFEILKAAVNHGRHRHVSSASTLKSVLILLYPGQERDIDAALKYWEGYELRKKQRAVASASDGK